MYRKIFAAAVVLTAVVLNAVLLTACASDADIAYRQSLQLATLTAAAVRSTATQAAQSVAYTQVAESIAAQKADADRAYIAASLQLTQIAATATQQANETQQAIQATRDAAAATRQAIQATQTSESIRSTQTVEARQTAQADRATQQSVQATQTVEANNTASTAQAQIIIATAAAVSAQTTRQSSETTATAQAIGLIEQRAAVDARVTQMALTVRGQEATNYAIAWLPIIAGAALFILLITIAARFTTSEIIARKTIRSQSGELLAVLDERHGQLTLMLPGRSMHPVIVNTPKGPTILSVDPGLQAQVVQRDQFIQAIRAANGQLMSGAKPALLDLPLPSGEGRGEGSSEPSLPIVAPWDRLNAWNGQSFLVGVTNSDTPITYDPLATPHLLVAGTSGAGKSMTILRPIAAQALAKGYTVVLVNDAGGDYAPLGNHPNLIRAGEGPAAAADVLTSVATEVDRRSEILRTNGASTWSRLPHDKRDGSPVMLIIDEMVALAWESAGDTKQRIWRAVIHITSKGRKMGISLVAGTTDPTERTLGREGLVMRDNCARIALRVLDASVSRVLVLQDGAERLGDNQFISVMRAQRTFGVAFHPEDQQISAYIQSRPIPNLPAPSWLKNKPEVIIGEVIQNETKEQKIQRLHRQNKNLAEIQREVFGYTGGDAYETVIRALRP